MRPPVTQLERGGSSRGPDLLSFLLFGLGILLGAAIFSYKVRGAQGREVIRVGGIMGGNVERGIFSSDVQTCFLRIAPPKHQG